MPLLIASSPPPRADGRRVLAFYTLSPSPRCIPCCSRSDNKGPSGEGGPGHQLYAQLPGAPRLFLRCRARSSGSPARQRARCALSPLLHHVPWSATGSAEASRCTLQLSPFSPVPQEKSGQDTASIAQSPRHRPTPAALPLPLRRRESGPHLDSSGEEKRTTQPSHPWHSRPAAHPKAWRRRRPRCSPAPCGSSSKTRSLRASQPSTMT